MSAVSASTILDFKLMTQPLSSSQRDCLLSVVHGGDCQKQTCVVSFQVHITCASFAFCFVCLLVCFICEGR